MGARLSCRSPIRSPTASLSAGAVNVPHVFLFSRNLHREGAHGRRMRILLIY